MINQKCKITYIANAGVLIEFNGTKILIDGIHSEKTSCFSKVPERLLDEIIKGKGKFNKIDYLLFTHIHEDHIDLEKTNKYVSENEDTVIIMPKNKELGKIHECDKQISAHENKILLDSQIGEIKEIVFDNIKIEYFRSIHDGEDYKNINNYCYIICIGSKSFIHLGDSKPNYEFFNEMLFNKKIDCALLNFTYLTLPSSRKIVREIVCPNKLIVLHLPFKADDEFGYRKISTKVLERFKDTLPNTTIFLEPMQEIVY